MKVKREATLSAGLQQGFECQAGWRPDAIALIDGDSVITYGDLNRRTNHLARHLRAGGVRPNDLIGIASEDSIEIIAGMLA